ncbi:MAG TPA: lysophospholipid acyltransferase family protein [Kiloniellales bacterium]|nr:lysophospholipid acyltransferase family protein [Kiloniellales bacterium]
MSLSKRILRSRPVQGVLAWLAGVYMRLIHATIRWRIERPDSVVALHERGAPYVGCFWHGRLLLMGAGLRNDYLVHMLVSQHRDGLLIARAIGSLGIPTVAGSSRRAGAGAMRTLLRLLAEGRPVGLTPDGPRGPRMRAKPGAVKTAQLAGVPLVPGAGAVSRRILFRSWDRFCLALPFGRGLILWGEPIPVPPDADQAELERLRLRLEEALNALTAEADRRFGHSPVSPAEAARAPRADHAPA